jgi:CheY-like chemotaxis protein
MSDTAPTTSTITAMSPHVLIVDDEPNIRTVMRVALEGHGYTVGEASSGEEALDMYTAGRKWDAVLLDERMSGMDGLETLRHLRQHDPHAVVIMVTAFASIELAVEAMKLGATDFMRKPMTPDTLRAAVDGALCKARGDAALAGPHQAAGAAAGPPSSSPSAQAASAAPAKRPYEVWMFNGLRLRHVPSDDAVTVQRFDVRRGPAEQGRPVVVEFTEGVAAAVADEAGRPLDDDRAFWIRQAALALGHYVWNKAEVPAEGRLLVDRVSHDLASAARQRR